MMSDRFMNRAVEISVGSLSPTINWTIAQAGKFALPPLDQQRRIAEILWAVDEVERRIGRSGCVGCALIVGEVVELHQRDTASLRGPPARRLLLALA